VPDGKPHPAARPQGRLVLVATPIGNLGDVTPRAAAALRDADVVAAEDTRRTGRLLQALHIDARGRLVSLFEHNEARRTPELVARMTRDHADVVLVSDAGTPAISDPGHVLVREAIAAGIEVVVVPGPCAAIAALAGSGLPTDRFLFVGFPPRKKGRARWMAGLADERGSVVLYESPLRLGRTLRDLAGALGGERPAAVARELTKLHEEFVRGTLTSLAARYADRPPKGEVVVVVGGRTE